MMSRDRLGLGIAYTVVRKARVNNDRLFLLPFKSFPIQVYSVNGGSAA